MNESLPHISTSFVPAGKPLTKSIKKLHSGLIAGSNDWKVLVDLPDSKYVFPPEIFATLERPDIVIWSGKLRKVLLIELTCPSEENIEVAQRSTAKPNSLFAADGRPSNKGARPAQGWSDFLLAGHILLEHVHAF